MKVYLDYAATTLLDPSVFEIMKPYFTEKFGNTVSLHSWGQEAKEAVEKSREKIADLLGVSSEELFFTGSATESNNWALKGVASANEGSHIIISSIEHPCVLEAAESLKKEGYKITKVPVNKEGFIDPLDIEKKIRKDTVLVSVIHASNEIGTIQPVKEIGKTCKEKGVLFHTDASQSFGKIPLNIENIDLLTVSSHKMYGPKGAALLFVRKGVKIDPLLHGGGQEKKKRSSTLNVPSIVGFGKAVELCFEEMEKEGKRQKRLRDKMIKEVLKIDQSYLNGSFDKRLPNNANFRFSFVEGESLMLQLDMRGVAVSTGSACSSEKLEPSHVLMALGLKPQEAHGSLRVSLGRYTKEKDIDYFLKVLPKIVKELREISPYGK